MQNRILTLAIVCITVLLTLWIFLNFQRRLIASVIFQTITNDAAVPTRLLFIAPEQLGIYTWNVGDSAVYQLKTNIGPKQISFHISAQDGVKTSNEFWLTTKGLSQDQETNIDVWRLLSPKSIRPGSEKSGFIFANNGLPFSLPQRPIPPYPVILEYIDDEYIETAVGTFKCRHYFCLLQAPDGYKAPLLEVWTNPNVLPMGIVRARWRDQILELVEMRNRPEPTIPEMLSRTMAATRHGNFQGIGISQHRTSVCTQCHVVDIGGKSLKQMSLTALSGTEFNLTQVLYHHYAAELADPRSHLSFQLTSQRGQPLVSQPLQFTSAKGSFQVRTNSEGRLVVSLNEMAHHNIRVTAKKGHLVLNTFTDGI